MKYSARRVLFVSAANISLLYPPMALAQEAVAAPEPAGMAAPGRAAAAAQEDSSPAEIVVTANKREQRIDKVGLAITAMSGDAMKDQHVVTLADLAATVPGLSYTPSPTQSPVYTLRGVGFYESSLGAYPTTSVYLDEVPFPFPVLTNHVNFDLERVEILKGPQGTLFGQNSTGGAINFIAGKPTTSFSAGADLTYGRFDNLELNAHVSGPLSDTVRARLAVTGARADDWQYSYTRNETIGRKKYYGARLTLDADPTDRLGVIFSLNGWRDQSDPQVPQYQTLLSQIPPATPQALRDYPFPPNSKARAADWSPSQKPFADNRLLQGSLRANWEVIDGITVTAISSLLDYKANQSLEADGTPFLNNDFGQVDGKIRSFNQELRVANDGSSNIRWVVGGNYERSRVFEDQENQFSDSAAAAVFGFTGAKITSLQHMRNLAAFGNLEYDLGEKFTLKGGMRYTSARRTSQNCSRDPGDGSLNAVLYGVAAGIQTGAIPIPGYTPTGIVTAPSPTGCISLDNVTFDGTPADYTLGKFFGRLKEDNVSWRVGVDYKPVSGLLFYANVARGYKAGSFPQASAATFEQYLPVTQEALTSYEAGFKWSASRAVQISGAGFYYDYKDKQLRSKIVDPLFGVLDALTNVPKSRLVGTELEVLFRPLPGFALGASGSILDSKITRFVGLNTIGQSTDYSGSVIPYTPKYQGRFTADYNWNAGSISPFVGIAVSSRSKQLANIGGVRGLVLTPDFKSAVPVDQTYTIKGYTLVDLRAGFETGDGWRVTLFGKNVFNKFYLTNIYTDYDTIARFTGRPATWGATVSFKFQ